MKSMAHTPTKVEPLQTSHQPQPEYPEFTVRGSAARDLMDHEPDEEYMMHAKVKMRNKSDHGKDDCSAGYCVTHAEFTPVGKKKKKEDPYKVAGDEIREKMKTGKY